MKNDLHFAELFLILIVVTNFVGLVYLYNKYQDLEYSLSDLYYTTGKIQNKIGENEKQIAKLIERFDDVVYRNNIEDTRKKRDDLYNIMLDRQLKRYKMKKDKIK